MTERRGAGRPTGPPALAERVVRRVVPGPEAELVVGELAEGFEVVRRRDGLRTARAWYRRQVWGFVLRAIAVRASTDHGEGEGMGGFEAVASDVRWAVRGLRKRPTFTLVAVATLALGIGANSAIFTLVSAHFFEPLPYDRPDELVLIWETGRNNMEVNTVAPGNYFTWRDEAVSFSDIAAYNVDGATLSGEGGSAEAVEASVVVPHFLDVLGVTPLIGPGFDEASVRAADGMQVVLGHGLWTRRYGADRSIIGRDIRIDGRPHTVVGVLPPSYRQPERSLTWQTTELWRPMLLDDGREDRGSRYLRTIARLSPGVTSEQAREEMTAMGRRLAEEFPDGNAGRAVLVRTLDEYLMGAARPTLVMLLVAGAAVLLIVCANVANLTLARGEERRREFALRAALGSGRGRLLRQVIVEGVVLALLGAAVGTALVLASSGLLQTVQSRYFTGLVDVGVDWRVIGFTVTLAVGSGVLSGLPLARYASRPDLRAGLVEGGSRAGRGLRGGATRSLLIVGQVAMATTLLVVAVLLSRSFNRLVNVSPGFDSEDVIAFSVTAPEPTYPDVAAIEQYHRDLTAALESTPGVSGVGQVSDLMFTTENMNASLEIEGRATDPEGPPTVELHVMLPGYFDVLDIPVLEGTVPDGWEVGDEVPAVINQRMAEMHWRGRDAIGARFTMSWRPEVPHRVVAVVGDILDDGYDAVADPAFYVPFGAMPRRRMAYVVRTVGAPSEVIGAVRDAVASVDADVPADDLGLLSGSMAETAARPRAASLIGLSFALIALLVATAGIYGVLSYAVQARTREIGIRSALGASGRELVGMVMRHSSRLILMGLVLGVIGALVAGRFLAGLLFGVRTWDPASLVAAGVVLGAAGLLASWLPARRAVAIDPTEALRAE